MRKPSGPSGIAAITAVVLAVALSGCTRGWCRAGLVYGTGAAVGGGLGGGLSQGSNSDGAIAGGAAGGFVGGAVLGAILAHYVCPAKAEPPPAPPPPPPPPARKKIETLTGPNFDFDKAVLRPDGRAKVDHVVGLMRDDASMRVALEGHTDAIGTDGYNQGLSERRANAVRAYMIAQGVSGDRITAAGFGESRPVADNDTEDGRARNRRVEIFAE